MGEFRLEILHQHIFLHALPAYLQDALAATNCIDLETLGDWVDQVMACPHCQTLPEELTDPLQDDLPSQIVSHVFHQDFCRNSQQLIVYMSKLIA